MKNLQDMHHMDTFKKLVKMRARMVWSLSALLVLALSGNLYLMSSGAELGARRFTSDGVVTFALAYSFALILLGAVIAGFYVVWANKKLDPLMKQVKQQTVSLSGEK